MDRNMVWPPPPQRHHRRGHSMGSWVGEKDEDLALFKDMGKLDKTPGFLYPGGDNHLIDAALSSKYGGLSHPQSAPPAERKGIGAELLNSDVDKTDYDWLMTPPGTPLFPSMDAESPALQEGALINRSLAAIKTSRGSTRPGRSNSPAPNVSRGNPSPSRRPSTPQNGGTRSQVVSRQASNSRPATPTRSSTPTSRASPNVQAVRPSTPTRQSSAPARPVTPLGARPATPTSSARRPVTPTLRRSSSSPTGSQPGAAGGAGRRNSSPARSTASTSTSARGISPARSGPSRGVSPVRGASPAPSRGRSPSPSLRAPYPVEASDDIPPNLRTTSDRPSSAQRRAVAYGGSPGEGRDPVSTLHRTPSPARSTAPSLSSSVLSRNLGRPTRAASSDSESSFDTGSQSGISNQGIATPDRNGSRRHMFGRGSDDYGRSSSLPKARRTSTSPQLGPSASKKSFESAAREYHRGQVAAFRPLMTNSSISTFYSSRASGLLRRPLTPSSTASSSEHGATVAHDSEVDDEDAGSAWKPSTRQQAPSGAHSPLHLFDKSLSDETHGTLDAISIVDNDELSSFFRTPEALEVESLEFKCLAQVDEQSQELNWLSRNEHVEDREYLWSRDVKDINPEDIAKQAPSGLDKIRVKLRHLKGTTENEETEPEAAVAKSEKESSLHSDSVVVNPTKSLQETCEVCGYRKQRQVAAGEASESWPSCRCSAVTATSLPFHEADEGGSARAKGAYSGESAEPKLANILYGKERDIWYIYRHSSEYEVPVAGYSQTKMEVDPPQVLAKEVHMKASAAHHHDLSRGMSETSPASVSAHLESSVEPSEDNISPTVYTGKSEHAEISKGPKEHISSVEKVSMGALRDEHLISDLAEGGNVATMKGKELDQEFSLGLAVRKGLEVGEDHFNRRISSHLSEMVDVGAGSESTPQTRISPEGGGEQILLKQAFNEKGSNQKVLDQQFENESTQVLCSSSKNVCKPLQMASELPQNPQMSVLSSSPVPHHRAVVITPMPQSSSDSAEKKSEVSGQPARREHDEYGVADIQGSHTPGLTIAEERRPNFSTESPHPAKEEKELPVHMRTTHAPPPGDPGSCTEAYCNEDHMASAMPEAKEEGLQSETQCGARPEACVPSRTNEHERTYPEPGDEVAFIDIPIDSCGRVTAGPRASDPRSVNAPLSPSSESQGHCPGPHMSMEKHLSGLQVGSPGNNNGEILKRLSYQEVQPENISCEEPHVLEKKINAITEHFDTSAGDVWNSLGRRVDIVDHTQKEKPERESGAAESTGESGKQFRRSGSAMQGASFSKSSSSKSSFRTPTSESSIDLSRSTDTTSSCPSNASWEDPHYGSKFWDSRLASDVARFSDVSEPAPLTKVFTADAAFREVKNGTQAQQSNSSEVNGNAVDQRLRASPDETASTAEHFDYIFECLGSKRDASPLAESKPPTVARISPEATNSVPPKPNVNADSQSVVKMNGSAKGTEASHKDVKALPRSQSIRENSKMNSRDAELVRSTPDSKVAMKVEEIVENAESPSPGGTRKHMSSFKFSHKKSANAEMKRSSTSTFSSNGASKVGVTPAGNGDCGTTGSKTSSAHTKLNGRPGSPSPHPSKGRSVRAASPARPLAAAKAPAAEPAGADGEAVPEELSIHSRFSNITVRSGSDTESFAWGPSSLEEANSRSGSSSGANTASMAVLRSSDHVPELGGHEIENGDEEEQCQNFSPFRGSEIQSNSANAWYDDGAATAPTVLNHSVLASRSEPLGSAHRQLEQIGGLGDDQKLSPEMTTANSVLRLRASNYAPTQNLDKLSEKLEQLETFGARVMLRNPHQQFLHSPTHEHSKDSRRLPALQQPQYLAASFNTRSSSSSALNRLDHSAATNRLDKSSKLSICRCTML